MMTEPEANFAVDSEEAELREVELRSEDRLWLKHQQLLDQISRPRYKRNRKLSLYPKGSTWSPGFIPDLLTRPAKRLASYQLKQNLVSAEIQRLEEEDFCIRGKLLAANAIELAFKMF